MGEPGEGGRRQAAACASCAPILRAILDDWKDGTLMLEDAAYAMAARAAAALGETIQERTLARGNPNHPVTLSLDGQWHKLCAVVMLKLGASTVTLTSNDIAALGTNSNIVVEARGETIVLRLVDDAEAARLVREHGGGAF